MKIDDCEGLILFSCIAWRWYSFNRLDLIHLYPVERRQSTAYSDGIQTETAD